VLEIDQDIRFCSVIMEVTYPYGAYLCTSSAVHAKPSNLVYKVCARCVAPKIYIVPDSFVRTGRHTRHRRNSKS
jgi:hypothetical protein